MVKEKKEEVEKKKAIVGKLAPGVCPVCEGTGLDVASGPNDKCIACRGTGKKIK